MIDESAAVENKSLYAPFATEEVVVVSAATT